VRRILALLISLLLTGCAPGPAVSATASTPAEQVQHGAVLPTWERNGYRDPDTVPALRELRSIGAEWVQFTPTWYQHTATSSRLYATDGTVADDELRRVIRVAHANGLRILLKPHVDVEDGTDRALIDPADRVAWFRSYRALVVGYARLAAELGVEEFAVGTELRALSGDRAPWLDVVAAVREVYSGQLVYAANYTEYDRVAFWDAVDLAGIDVYWPLAAQPTADAAVLQRAFEARRDGLAALSERIGRRILFTEAGFPSQRGGVTAPWEARRDTAVDQDEQAAAYTALLATFTGQPWWAGVFWWTWTVAHQHDVNTPAALDHSVRGKRAAEVLRHWWAS
jgi:hypothetical protein